MVSVVVLNWNGKPHLRGCLQSLRRQEIRETEVILVDNGSRDGSVAFVKKSFPEVRVIENRSNLGFCAGNNVGIRAARGRLIALLNNDTEVSRRWLKSLKDAAASHPKAGLFASRMLIFDQPELIDSAGDLFHTAGFASKRGWREHDGPRFHKPCPVFGACAGAVLYRRDMLEDIGLLDEDFFANGEDVDLSFRAQLRGYACRYVPEAEVFHKGGATIGRSARWFYLMRRNQLWVAIKNMPADLMHKYWPQMLFYNLSSLVYHPLKGRGGLIFSAYRDAFRNLGKMRRKRRQIQHRRCVDSGYIDAILSHGGLFQRARRPVTRRLESSAYSIH